jgi:hypothetical protein
MRYAAKQRSTHICVGSFIPDLVAFEDHPVEPLLIIEDLSEADWDVRWDASRLAAVRTALTAVATSAAPPHTPPVREMLGGFGGWERVCADREPFLSTGLRSAEWLERALPILLDVDDAAVEHLRPR